MSNLDLKKPIVFFDLETTGLNVYEDRIVELAMCRVTPDGLWGTTLTWRFNPGIPISKEATEVHGITDEMVAQCPPFSEHAGRIAMHFKGADIGGFNVKRFDIPMLMVELGRCKERLDFPCHIVDSCEIFHQREPRDLAAAYRFYRGTDMPETAHSAGTDVQVAAAVLIGQLERYRDIPHDPEGIHKMFTDPGEVDLAGQLLRKDDGTIIVTFGKHKGKALDKLPLDYLSWLKKNDILGPDVLHLLNAALGKGYRMKHGRAKGR